MPGYTIFDDQDREVLYYGDWEHGTVDADVDAWDNTVSATRAEGAGAVFSFRGEYVRSFTSCSSTHAAMVLTTLFPLLQEHLWGSWEARSFWTVLAHCP